MPKTSVIKPQYGFPLFTQSSSTDFLVSGEKLRVTDLWGLWHYILKGYVKRHGKKKIDYSFLLSLIEQAQYFYSAATKAPLKSQPLLYYYSFLNAAKVFITLRNPTLHTSGLEYNHGIDSCPISAGTKLSTTTVQVKSLIDNGGNPQKISVANRLSIELGDNMKKEIPLGPGNDNGPWIISVKSLFQYCIGIHRTVSETFKEKEHFVRLIDPELNKTGRNLLFKAKLDAPPSVRTSLTNAGYDIIHDSHTNQSSVNFKYMALHTRLNKGDFKGLGDIVRGSGIWYYSTVDEHRLYISSKSLIKKAGEDSYSLDNRTPGNTYLRLSSATVIYYLMFFLGSVTRYHPYMFESMLSDKEIWMIGEFLNTQPYQFINTLVSKLLSTPVYGSRMPVL